MARPLRIQFENAYYHLTCRGNGRQRIFADDSDRKAFLGLLGRSGEVYQVEVLAYVLMTNHFHLLVKTPLANVQEFMRHFNISYTSYFNRKHKRTGHLYQGRYKSFLIDADDYLQQVSRYIHLNPIRIQRGERLSFQEKKAHLTGYQWSSYPGYLVPKRRRDWLQVDEVLGDFGGDRGRGRKGYECFVLEGIGDGVKNPLEQGKGHGIIGEEDFIERVKGRFLGRRPREREMPAVRRITARLEAERIIEVVCKVTGVGRGQLLRKGQRGYVRGLLMEVLYRYGGLNQREIGALMGVDYSSVSVGRKRLQEEIGKNQSLRRKMEEIQNEICQ
jgi:putative transposase